MHWQTLLGLAGAMGLLAFIVFAFVQGFKVKPRRGRNTTADASALTTDINQHNL